MQNRYELQIYWLDGNSTVFGCDGFDVKQTQAGIVLELQELPEQSDLDPVQRAVVVAEFWGIAGYEVVLKPVKED
jgi:hypothetical protein